MENYLVEAIYVVERRVVVKVSADTEDVAEAKILEMIGSDPLACHEAMLLAVGIETSPYLLMNIAKMVPHTIIISQDQT